MQVSHRLKGKAVGHSPITQCMTACDLQGGHVPLFNSMLGAVTGDN